MKLETAKSSVYLWQCPTSLMVGCAGAKADDAGSIDADSQRGGGGLR